MGLLRAHLKLFSNLSSHIKSALTVLHSVSLTNPMKQNPVISYIPNRKLLAYTSNSDFSDQEKKKLFNKGNKVVIRSSPIQEKRLSSNGDPIESEECDLKAEKGIKCIDVKQKETCKPPPLQKGFQGNCGPVICMPCCKNRQPLNVCRAIQVKENLCKPSLFKYRSYAQSVKKPYAKDKCDCCYPAPQHFIGIKDAARTWAKLRENQEYKLRLEVKKQFHTLPLPQQFIDKKEEGRYYEIQQSKKLLCKLSEEKRNFSTFTPVLLQNECSKKNGLPCLKRDETLLKKVEQSKKACNRICVPCCRPARDPADCSSPYEKPACVKRKPPRPSFSECQDTLVEIDPCECIHQVEVCRRPRSS